MKTIALIDTRSEVPGINLGILVSTHPDMMAAFASNDAFQETEASGRHIRTKIVTLKGQLAVGQAVQPSHLALSKNAQMLVRLKRTLTLPNGRKLVKSPPGDGWFPVEVRGDQFFSEYGPEIRPKDIAEIRISEHWNE
jgi:hypothetical protein